MDKLPKGDKKIYKVDYQIELTRSVTSPQHLHSVDKEREFTLVDPVNPKESQMLVVPGSEAQAHNICRKRRFYKSVYDYNRKDTRNFDKLSLVAYEGSALSLLGMISYDPQTDSFKMTQVSGFISGGLKEAIRFFD